MASETRSGGSELSDTMRAQMRVIVEHAEKLEAILAKSKDAPPQTSPNEVIRSLASATGIEFRILRLIFTGINNLSVLKKEVGTSDAAIDRVAQILKDKIPNLDKERGKIKTAVDAYSDDNPVAISLKAQRLTHLYAQLFVDGEIITDARPVFDSKAEKVLEYLITHSLILTMHDDESGSDFVMPHKHARVHVALDLDDIVKLRNACERAILKTKTLKTELGEKGKVIGG